MKYIMNNPIVYLTENLYAFIYDLNKSKVVYKYKPLHDKQTRILNQLKKVKNLKSKTQILSLTSQKLKLIK